MNAAAAVIETTLADTIGQDFFLSEWTVPGAGLLAHTLSRMEATVHGMTGIHSIIAADSINAERNESSHEGHEVLNGNIREKLMIAQDCLLHALANDFYRLRTEMEART